MGPLDVNWVKDTSSGRDIRPMVEWLRFKLQRMISEGRIMPIQLIGFSEGAATLLKVLQICAMSCPLVDSLMVLAN